jgi:predicted nucleic acid-binding protein
MIVVDTKQLAYLLIGGKPTQAAREVLLQDPEWSAPILWRSEFRSVLALYLRRGELQLPDALKLQHKAEQLLAGREHLIGSERVLRLVADSNCSAYDCEFVALAKDLRVPLVTSDNKMLRAFPEIAVSPQEFVRDM